MEKLRRGRRARGTGPFQARLDGMGWPAMRTPLGGRREFRVAAFYAPARKLPVTFGRGAAPPRPREGRDGGGHRRRWTGRGSLDRKSTRLNSSHVRISYAVFCLKKKKKKQTSA